MKLRTYAAAALLGFLTVATSAYAEMATKPVLTLEAAKQGIAAAASEARRNKAGAAIAVVDDGNLIALERLDTTFVAGANISIGKARTAAMFKRPTKFFEDVIKNGRTAMVTLADFTPLQGGVPITVDGQVIGAIGVSGAASAQQDEEIAMVGARAAQSAPMRPAAMSSGVTHFDSARVATAFAKGMPLGATRMAERCT